MPEGGVGQGGGVRAKCLRGGGGTGGTAAKSTPKWTIWWTDSQTDVRRVTKKKNMTDEKYHKIMGNASRHRRENTLFLWR